LVNQPQPRNKRGKLSILLVISNLLVGACFFWFLRKEPGISSPAVIQEVPAPEKIQDKPAIVPPIKMAPAPQAIIKKPEAAAPSIAEIVASRKTPAPQQPATKIDVEKNPAPVQLKPDLIKQDMESKSKVSTQIEPIEIVEKKPEPVAENKTIPFLFELPSEFRHTVPELKINVFVYSEQPAERFVMIDMVKYTVGEQIKESIKLKEIRSDSLVVEFNSRTFKIKRP
ncbi:MAG: general secretion pathway protein GspB, partial [Methylococcaceae bacterium]